MASAFSPAWPSTTAARSTPPRCCGRGERTWAAHARVYSPAGAGRRPMIRPRCGAWRTACWPKHRAGLPRSGSASAGRWTRHAGLCGFRIMCRAGKKPRFVTSFRPSSACRPRWTTTPTSRPWANGVSARARAPKACSTSPSAPASAAGGCWAAASGAAPTAWPARSATCWCGRAARRATAAGAAAWRRRRAAGRSRAWRG